MASPGGSSQQQEAQDATALASNAAFMDKYSRQIGAFGMEAMSKLIQLKVCVGVWVGGWWGGWVVSQYHHKTSAR